MKADKGSIWLYRSLENHSLSQKLSWLLSDQTHLLSCYQRSAYLCQEKYAEALLICLRAVERNQPGLMSEIDPSLFLCKTRSFHKVHRRCSSFPDAHFKTLNQFSSTRSKTFSCMTSSVSEDEELVGKCSVRPTKKICGKIKPWSSMPSLDIDGK